MLARWLTVSVVAIGLGVAALELSACLAVEPRAGTPISGLFTDAVEPELPIGAKSDHDEASALPRFTQ